MFKNRFFSVFLTGVVLLAASLVFNVYHTRSVPEIAARATGMVAQKSEECREGVNALFGAALLNDKAGLYDFYNKEGIGLYLFVKDSLVFWNNAQLPVAGIEKKNTAEGGLLRLRHGYFLYAKSGRGDSLALGICLLKPLYELQNKYLSNAFAGWTGIPDEVGFSPSLSGAAVVRFNNEALFSLSGTDTHYTMPWVDNLCFGAFVAGLCFLLTGLLLIAGRQPSPRTFALMLFSVVGLRSGMILLKWPAFFYRSLLYDLHVFGNAQSFFDGYLGDMFLNALILFFIAASFYFFIKPAAERPKLYAQRAAVGFLAGILAFQFNSSAVSLVTNSTLNFDLLNIFNTTLPVLVALATLCIYSIAFFVAVKKLLSCFSFGFWSDLRGFVLVHLLISFLLAVLLPRAGWFQAAWPGCFALSYFFLTRAAKLRFSLVLGFQILLMSAITSAILTTYIEKNQKQDLEVLSEKLGERQDPILESEFARIPAAVQNDESLANLMKILPSTQEEIKSLLNQKYFNEYFKRYYIELSLFNENCEPQLSVADPLLLNEGFFTDQIKFNSDSTLVKDLFFVRNYRKNSRYIGVIPLRDHRLYVMMKPRQFEELGSFPDLLLDQPQQKPDKLKGFSYAVYRSGQSTVSYGSFSYPLFLPDHSQLQRTYPDHVHHYSSPDETTTVIISRYRRTWNYFFTFNSYMLLFFSLISYCVFMVYAFIFTDQFRDTSLTRRIQTIIIVLLLLAMSAVGLTSARLVTKQFEEENKKQLKEKTEIILNELSQFKPGLLFDPAQRESVNQQLSGYARLFNTDVSLFDSAGHLFTTSQSRLYNLGLAATLANPVAMQSLSSNLASAVSIRENAGALTYLSLYTPLYDNSNQLTGYINLPYFARQNDLVNELSGIISGLVNVYVILFVLSILAGLILSGYITRPLRLIQQQIANISLGRRNEQIVWQSHDEIGKLIAEYNQMLVKLEQSAGLLAKSERESAWREMAKQVAHEIKNPLTPMKLNLQYLQHLMKNDPADFREKFEKASAGIIEQIDALANIANEFSHFAKLPVTQLQTLNLAEIINSAVQVFGNREGISILNRIKAAGIAVKGDREQCLRVFNNILSNAVQALEGIADPYIAIDMQRSEGRVVVLISDNGCGIGEELKARIFTPNFTTKSTGSGLGLAMVKSIMEGFGGRIWFSSEKNKGTVFFLEFISAGQENF